jgi:hypothetical protein
MMEVFGEKLAKMSLDGESEKEGLEGLVMANKKIEAEELPSPEQLKGRILLNTSNSHFFQNGPFPDNVFFRPRIWELLRVDSLDREGYYTNPSSSAS